MLYIIAQLFHNVYTTFMTKYFKILLDFYLGVLYDKDMFKQKIYQELLESLPFAAEIRSFNNKILAYNQEGQSIFGTKEDPFLFFRQETDTNEIQKLDSAFLQRSTFQTELARNDIIYRIQIRPLSQAMLITATSQPQTLSISHVLQTQLTLFKNIMQNINIPIYLIDISGEIIYINTEFSTLIGYPYSQVLGQQITTFLNLNQLKFEPFFETDLTISTPQGVCPFNLKQIQLQELDSPLFLGTLQPALRPQLNETEAVWPFPWARISIDTGTIIKTNAAFLKICESEQNPQSLKEVFTSSAIQDLLDKLGKTHKQSTYTAPMEMETLQGDAYQVYYSVGTIIEQEANLYCIDISSKKNLEKQILQAHKMQAIGQLTGGIAHDFNNILTAIMGFTDLLLQQHPAGDESFADLMHIKGNVQKAAGLVGQLLTFSRKTPLQEHLISVHDAFVDLTSLLQRAIAPHCRLKMDFKRHLGFIKMDINQLTQVFLNFAVNAKDAMPKGGELTISLTKEEIKKARSCGNEMIPVGTYVKITVTDNGLGIRSDILPHIFDPFFTTKKKSNQSGTGLGLSTVYGIIHSAGGFIKVDSEPNIGTTFTVYLPRFEEQAHEVSPITPEIQNVFLPTPKAPILLVDDEESIRTVTARALQAKGFEIEQATNAEEGLEILKKCKTPFQLLISDMVMPGMDGEQLIKEAKKLFPQLPCLLMSGYSASFEKHTANKMKNFHFISKPFVLADLLTTVKEILEKDTKM